MSNPNFVGKYLHVIKGKIRLYLACSEGCLGGVKSGQGLHCVVNPLVGYDDKPVKQAPDRKRYAVVAGLWLDSRLFKTWLINPWFHAISFVLGLMIFKLVMNIFDIVSKCPCSLFARNAYGLYSGKLIQTKN